MFTSHRTIINATNDVANSMYGVGELGSLRLDYLKLNLQLNDNLAPIQHFRGCECGVYRQYLRSIIEKNTFWRTHCRIYKSATVRNIHVFVLLLHIKNPMIGFTVKS